MARCNTSCEARFTAGRNGNGPRRTAGVQNRGNFSPHPTKGPWSQGARESGNHPPAAAHQQPRHDHSFPTRTISYAYTWQVICGMPISGRPMTDTDYLYTGYPACTALGQLFFFFLLPFLFSFSPLPSRVSCGIVVCRVLTKASAIFFV